MIEDFCYAHFTPLGRGLLKVFKGVEDNMEAANMRRHPEVYLSIIGFLAATSITVPILYFALLLLGKMPSFLSLPFLMPIFLSPPLIILLVGVLAPKTVASNRVSGLKSEIPYASAYLSVMASGGLSPYQSLLRLGETELLPNLRKEIGRIQRITLSSGLDPVSAMAEAARVMNLREYKELLLGYASTVRTGGDVLHYLYSQTETMFRSLAQRIKSMGEKMGLLMEIYTIVAILGALGLYMVFIVSLSFPEFQAFPRETFFLFAFIILPSSSLVFIYLGETIQISYPSSNLKTYTALLASVPLGLFLVTQMVLPFYIEGFPSILIGLPVFLRTTLNLYPGCGPALGLALSLIILSLPVYVTDRHYSGGERKVFQGITSFLRDLVETRKTGLSPEKSIQSLSNRDYGGFSKHLKLMSAKIGWGISLKQIFEDFKGRVKSWLSQINLYLLIDTMEVGGGTEESLETLAEFAESSMILERERKSILTPLLLVPYLGIAILTTTTIMLLQLFINMGELGGGTIISPVTLTQTLVTPLILHAFTLGLVTGKIVSGRVSAGFKHAIILITVSLAGIWIAQTRLTGF